MFTVITIPGIHCEGCSALIKDISSDFPAISHIAIDLTHKRVTLEHDETLDFDAWKTEVEAANPAYTVQKIEN
jgi:copper chaperone CopZ